MIHILDPKSERKALGHSVSFNMLASGSSGELCGLLAIWDIRRLVLELYLHLSKTHCPGHWVVAGGHTLCLGTILKLQVCHFWVLGPRSIVLCVCTFPCPRSWLVLFFCRGLVVVEGR